MPIGARDRARPHPGPARRQPGAVHAAWRLHAGQSAAPWDQGIYQGWDLHPAQLPGALRRRVRLLPRRAARQARRLRAFVAQATQATRTGQVFDDAATGRGLLNFFVRGVACGALTEAEALATGLSADALSRRAFAP